MALQHVVAAPIRIEFAGVWRDQVLPGTSVKPGEFFGGVFVYDPDQATVVFHRDGLTGEVTDYAFSPGGASLELNILTPTGLVTFRSDASAMFAEVMNDYSDGSAPAIDRFVIQSFASAQFPTAYARAFQRLDVDIFDSDLSFLSSPALPASVRMPSNGSAMIGIQGGADPSNLDYNAAGNLQAVGSSLIEQFVPCAGPVIGGEWENHGAYVSAVAQAAQTLLKVGAQAKDEVNAAIRSAAQSDCGKK